MKKFCVYVHTFPNGKKYIGITCKTPNKRWQNGTGYDKDHQPVMYNAIKKYGWGNVSHEVLFDGLTLKEAAEKEKELIALHKTNCSRYGNEYGYNMTDGGEGTYGHKAGENVIKKNRERLLGKTGKDCCNSRPVICDGTEYESLTDFKEKNNYPKGNIAGWLSGKVGMPKHWYDKKLHYKDTDFSSIKCSDINLGRVIIDEMTFESLKEASEYLSVSNATLCYYLSGKKKLPQNLAEYNIHYEGKAPPKKLIAKKAINQIEYDGKIFESQKALADYLHIHPATLSAWLVGKNPTPEEYKQKGLKRIE